ncbi:hypothetical protein CHELA40_12288 [Chelatococcus asaccharovorans]|nr:hypothetical protein CHELA40_12288 [Chelatococcus asaccharovorans]CAH1683077.1 hypothetical protein CHELA17_63319 [Chelatococcus asaccharovorans]
MRLNSANLRILRCPAQSCGAKSHLVVLLRHLHPPDTGLGANVGATRTTSKSLVLVELLNLTFDLEPHVRRDSNVKFAPGLCFYAFSSREPVPTSLENALARHACHITHRAA